MPLDVLGCTRATLTKSANFVRPSQVAIFDLPQGIPSKRKSSACVDYVPALCTHRPSLLPIGWFSEVFGLRLGESKDQPWLREVDQI